MRGPLEFFRSVILEENQCVVFVDLLFFVVVELELFLDWRICDFGNTEILVSRVKRKRIGIV